MVKLVKESLYEFKKGVDPLKAMGLGREGSIRKFFRNLNIPDENYIVTADQIIFNRGLYLDGYTELIILPEGLTVGGYLYLRSCTKLTSLPEGLTVGMDLNLRGCTELISLPEGLTVGWSLDLKGCTKLTKLPKDLNVKHNIHVTGDQLELIDFIENSDEFKNKLKIDG